MAIVLDHVNHIYEEGTSISFQALTDINLVIPDGQFIAARSDWYFSIRSTSFLKPMCLQMSVLDQRTWDLTGKRWN